MRETDALILKTTCTLQSGGEKWYVTNICEVPSCY